MFEHTKIMKDEEIHITRLEEEKKDKMKWWEQGKFEDWRRKTRGTKISGLSFKDIRNFGNKYVCLI